MSCARLTICCTSPSDEPRSQRPLLLAHDEDLRHLLLPCERHERVRDVLASEDAGVDLEPSREAEMTLDPIAVFLAEMPQIVGLRHVDAQAICLEVIRHASAAANQRGARGMRLDEKQHALFRRRGGRRGSGRGRLLPAGVAGLDGVRGLAHRQFTQRDERRLAEEILEGGAGPVGRIDHAALQTVEQRTGRQVDHDHLVRLPHHPVRDRLPDPHARALPDLVVQALDVLHVHRGQDVDARIEQDVNVLPSLGARRAGDVGVRELVDDRHLGPPPQDGVGIHFLEQRPLVLHRPPRHHFEALDQRHRVLPAMRLEIADHDVDALVLQLARLGEHLVGLAHARGVAEEDLQTTALRRLRHHEWTIPVISAVPSDAGTRARRCLRRRGSADRAGCPATAIASRGEGCGRRRAA